MLSYIQPLVRAAEIAGDSEAIVDEDTRLTYKALLDRCFKLAGGLATLALSPGDRIAVLLQNSHRFLELYITIPAAGYRIVPLNTRHSYAELRYILEDADVKVLLTDQNRDDLHELVKRVILVPDEYEELIKGAHEVDLRNGRPDAEEVAGLFYTGGTTGKSKGVVLTHRNILESARLTLMAQHYSKDDRFGLVTPMFHSGGFGWLFAVMWMGGCCVTLPKFTPDGALDLIQKERITRTFAITTMFAAMAEEQERNPRDIDSLRWIGHAGQPCPDEVLRRACNAFPRSRIWTVYGATETTASVVFLEDERALLGSNGKHLGTCGQAGPGGVELKVVNADGSAARIGEIGEIVVRADCVAREYWNKPEETSAALVNGWFYSGDLGYLDSDHYLFLVDRKKDMIITGGENVYSTEVETILYRHPAVLEAVVFGVPDIKWGEAVHAVVVLRSNATEKELIEFCHQHIAGYKIPKRIEIHGEPLPKSGAGKILKESLREPFWHDNLKRIN